jgi:hypothetical protein
MLNEGFKQADYIKMKRKEDKHARDAFEQGPDPQELSGKYRSKSRNRALKMSGIRDAMMRGEDPRKDTRGGAYARRGNPDEDHRANFTYNQSFMPNYKKRRTKKAGVGETEDVKEAKTFEEFMIEAYMIMERPYQIYGPDPHGASDSEPRPLGKPYKNKKRAKTRADKLDQEIGGYRHFVRKVDEN